MGQSRQSFRVFTPSDVGSFGPAKTTSDSPDSFLLPPAPVILRDLQNAIAHIPTNEHEVEAQPLHEQLKRLLCSVWSQMRKQGRRDVFPRMSSPLSGRRTGGDAHHLGAIRRVGMPKSTLLVNLEKA